MMQSIPGSELNPMLVRRGTLHWFVNDTSPERQVVAAAELAALGVTVDDKTNADVQASGILVFDASHLDGGRLCVHGERFALYPDVIVELAEILVNHLERIGRLDELTDRIERGGGS